ncbi:dTDP-4-amino-4,6-dideoxygalactose transaminase [Gillisia sp. Hel_I_86]|uniref:dTDP-4-amino-4,6-dideoxygalactose transaminase n=1 Tax=Gillisia sp. Hel_I_86 TaxID=1249981 RepID=UPI00119B18DB|nr:dTDP-4-amino-4,6-dideoxygalactose transaminase [Gillisia sp. Hel_I_86]TVZ28204.1 dTDP-4-amino-4,6-dideoxygalactose transaminase [Gillisia sp. Hel_I_86]
MNIPFNKPYISGNELSYIKVAMASGKLSGAGKFTNKCQRFFEEKYKFGKCLLTTSCTDALEMAAILINIQPGDEVIMPAYTFVSTANAFVLRGAKIIFVDSRDDHPGMDESKIESLISPRTKAIVPVHYAGVACDMDIIMGLANRYDLFVIEDVAHAIDSYYIGNDGVKSALGSFGHLSTFSFHETKNIISGEGGMLVINDSSLMERSEIIWEKGTNRSAFFRGEIAKYSWVDIGSSFLPSEITAAFLWAQLEHLEEIQKRRIEIWNLYREKLQHLSEAFMVKLPVIPNYATNNGHMFYMVCENMELRSLLIERLKENDILAVFHYLSLHKSPFYSEKYHGTELKNSDRYSQCLLRLPFYFELGKNTIDLITNTIDETIKAN